MNGKQITILVEAVVHEDCDLHALANHTEEVFFSDDPDLFPQLQVVVGVYVRAWADQ